MNKKPNPKSQKNQVAELTEALQRERADVINVRRQHQLQIEGLKKVVQAEVVGSLLPVIDNFDRSLKHVPAELADSDFLKGIQGVVKQFDTTLNQMGVNRIKTVGETFDPRLHEAVSMEEGDGTREVISEEVQAGYTLGTEVLRHAVVKVKTEH